jgi:hypothetical protein
MQSCQLNTTEHRDNLAGLRARAAGVFGGDEIAHDVENGGRLLHAPDALPEHHTRGFLERRIRVKHDHAQGHPNAENQPSVLSLGRAKPRPHRGRAPSQIDML